MNQIFRITVGQETLQGRLPPVRVGKGYCSLFHIYGVAHRTDVPAPRIWITTEEETLYWIASWDSEIGAWVVDVSTEATVDAAVKEYALTVFGNTLTKEYLVGQGPFVVYNNIAGGTGATGATGGTAGASLLSRIVAMEERFASLAEIPAFDPEQAFDIDLRTQVQVIGNKLRGSE